MLLLMDMVMDITNRNTTKVGQSVPSRKTYIEIPVSKLRSGQRPARIAAVFQTKQSWPYYMQFLIPSKFRAVFRISRTSTMERFCENSYRHLAVNCFRKKAPSQMFDWAINTPLKLTTIYYLQLFLAINLHFAGNN